MRQVLVVDDDPGIRQLLTYAFSMEGYAVETLADGRDVVERLRAAESRVVVLMDVMMPHMDGMVVCRRLLDEPALLTRHAIILMSAGFPAGASLPEGTRGALPKPFRLERVFALVERFAAEPLSLGAVATETETASAATASCGA